MTDFYSKTGTPASHSSGSSASMRAEFTAIETAMAKLAGYTGNGSKFLRVNAAGTAYEALSVADALAALAPSSAALATALTDTTGTGVFVRTQAPTLTSAVLVTPALGTPASGVLTNCTGTAAGLTAGNVTTNANLTGHITSVGNAAVLGSFTSAQLNTAVSDADIATIAGVETLTNKTLTAPALGTPASGNLANCTFPTLNQDTTGSSASCTGNAATATNATTADSATKSGVPQNSQSAAYTTVLADANKHILHPTADNNARTFTIDSNANVAYDVGTTLTFVNQINTVTIAITTDTMTLASAGTTGNRTLAANGIATAIKIAATSWLISGSGLS